MGTRSKQGWNFRCTERVPESERNPVQKSVVRAGAFL